MVVSMAIGVDNVAQFTKEEGRIVAVRPAGWQWGTEEVKQFLIVTIDLGSTITTIEDAQKLTIPHFETGELYFPSIDVPEPKILHRRRYKIPFADIQTRAQALGVPIDFNRIRDMGDEYQPVRQYIIPHAGMLLDRHTENKLTDTNLIAIRNAGK